MKLRIGMNGDDSAGVRHQPRASDEIIKTDRQRDEGAGDGSRLGCRCRVEALQVLDFPSRQQEETLVNAVS